MKHLTSSQVGATEQAISKEPRLELQLANLVWFKVQPIVGWHMSAD